VGIGGWATTSTETYQYVNRNSVCGEAEVFSFKYRRSKAATDATPFYAVKASLRLFSGSRLSDARETLSYQQILYEPLRAYPNPCMDVSALGMPGPTSLS
jgi:hypothetical protein